MQLHLTILIWRFLLPNPASDYIVIDVPSSVVQHGVAQITDVLGKLVLTEKVTTSKQRVTLNKLPKGVYIFSVLSSEGRFSQQIIKAW